ncbi:MAG: DUF4350 domain-containing protein [Erythrobacter sp.]
MSEAAISNPVSGRGASPFSRGAVLAVLVVGFAAFLSMLWFIGSGDTGGPGESGVAHASSRGLDGYAGLAELLEAEGIEVEKSRGADGLDTLDLLILTPSRFADPEDLTALLRDRQYLGPTMVILPKWATGRITGELSEEDQERVRSDWVALLGSGRLTWTEDLPAPFTFTLGMDNRGDGNPSSWAGLDLSGKLPAQSKIYVEQKAGFEPVIIDDAGRMLAFNVVGIPGTDYYENAHWVMFVVEPDLMNNYGLADGARAAAALALVREAGYGDLDSVTMDLSLHGYGASTNLLTLAFQPPFLAATLCLILAMLIVGWRAFLRFGPTAVSGQDIAFGKQRLVSNGAGLIVRARRLGLLADPYVTLVERRLGKLLGIARPDPASIDHALSIRLPGEEPFSSRAARLQNASKPMEILRAARSLNELTGKLSR